MRACCLARTGGGGCRPYFFLIKVFYCKWHGQTKQGSREASSSILGGDQGQRGRCCKGWGTLVQGAAGGWRMCRVALGARDRGRFFPALQQGWLLHPWVILSPHRHCGVQKGSPPAPQPAPSGKATWSCPQGHPDFGASTTGSSGTGHPAQGTGSGPLFLPCGFFLSAFPWARTPPALSPPRAHRWLLLVRSLPVTPSPL